MKRAEYEETCRKAWESLPEPVRRHLPLADAWAILPETREYRMAKETERRYALYRLLSEGVDRDGRKLPDREILRKREAFRNACANDPVFFIENCIWTIDPEAKVGVPGELPLFLFGYSKELWVEPWWKGAVSRTKNRRTTVKSRRMKLTTDRMAFEVWGFRFLPGRRAWVATDKEDKLDRHTDWNSLLGKFRCMWRFCRGALPWLFPELPPHSEWNQKKRLTFPEWREKGKKIDESVWGNELLGVLPSDPRSGAASDGFVDEAAHIEQIEQLYDAAESMTHAMTQGSTAPPSPANPFWERRSLPGVEDSVVPWWRNPLNLQGVHWSDPSKHPDDAYPGEDRGPYTKRWRSDVYNREAKQCSPQEMGRNWDIDPLASAGARIFLSFNRERNCGQPSENDPTWDLWRPDLETIVGYDPGRGDPAALIWAQIDPVKSEVLIVDYDMSADKTVHYFVPELLGWPWFSKPRWRTSPEALPWHEAVPWSYPPERIERIERWNRRRDARGGRPKLVRIDFAGTQHTQNDLYSLTERLQAYGLPTDAAPMQYKMENWLEKADEVLLRTRISGRLVGYRPEGHWPAIDECFEFWRRRERSDATKVGKPMEPLHDVHSHTCTAFTFLVYDLPMLMRGRVVDREKNVQAFPEHFQGRMVRTGRGLC